MRTSRPGRRLGPCLVAVVLALAAAACSDDGAKREEGQAGFSEAGEVSVYDLAFRDCLDVSPDPGDQVEKLRGVPCDEPHTHEVYAIDPAPLAAAAATTTSEVGSDLTAPADALTTTSTTVPAVEVLLDQFDTYPGAPDVESVASRFCFTAFEQVMGVAVADSELTFTYLYPTLQSWNDPDLADRTIACLVVAATQVSEPMIPSLVGFG